MFWMVPKTVTHEGAYWPGIPGICPKERKEFSLRDARSIKAALILKKHEVPATWRGYRWGVDNSKMEQQRSFQVKAGMKNSAAAPFCVEVLSDPMTRITYEHRNYSSDPLWAFCNERNKMKEDTRND